jgi:hypothetical protein
MASTTGRHDCRTPLGRRQIGKRERNENDITLLVLAAVTSHVAQAGPAVFIGRGDVEAGALPKDSLARPGKLFTRHASLVVKRICRLTPTRKDDLLSELRAFFSE